MAATVSKLFNTGVDDTNHLLPQGAADPHYTTKFLQTGASTSPFVCREDPSWVHHTNQAQWISPNADNHGELGDWDYTTTFQIQNLTPITRIRLSGIWAADDTGLDIRLNGSSQGVTQVSFNQFKAFNITSGFQNGQNTLVFKVHNIMGLSLPDPTGLIVQFNAPDITEEKFEYEYAAKFVAGKQPNPDDMLLARGFYATTVNIHNPNYDSVRVYKKLALTFPPAEERPGAIQDIALETLGPDEAFKVDGNEIRTLFPNLGLPSNHVEGFVVVQSHASLDVVAVYTTAVLDKTGNVTDHSAIEVVQVRERYRAPSKSKEKDGKEAKEGKDKEKEVKEHKDKDKDVKEGKEIKEKEKEKEKEEGKESKESGKEQPDVKVIPDKVPHEGASFAGWSDVTGPAGSARTFIQPDERPAVGQRVIDGDSN